jgi:hypothetical protein
LSFAIDSRHESAEAVTFVDPDDLPTQPSSNSDPAATVVFRLFSDLAPIDRRRLARLVEAWFSADIEARILIEEVAFALVKTRPR